MAKEVDSLRQRAKRGEKLETTFAEKTLFGFALCSKSILQVSLVEDFGTYNANFKQKLPIHF